MRVGVALDMLAKDCGYTLESYCLVPFRAAALAVVRGRSDGLTLPAGLPAFTGGRKHGTD